MVMGPAATQVGEPFESWSLARKRQKAKCQRWQIEGDFCRDTQALCMCLCEPGRY